VFKEYTGFMRCLGDGPREWKGGIKVDGREQAQENGERIRQRINEANSVQAGGWSACLFG